jgi:hypothetical protein
LVIEHENVLTSRAGALSFHDQQFESQAFNDEYRRASRGAEVR